MYVYIQSEKHEFGGLWTVGHYAPSGEFIPESDHGSKEEAAKRVNYLNGGQSDDLEELEIRFNHHLNNEYAHKI